MLGPLNDNETPIVKTEHTRPHKEDRDPPGCRSTLYTDHQTRPAAAGVAKTCLLSSIATPRVESSSPRTIHPEFWLRSLTAGGHTALCFCVQLMWLCDCACDDKRVGGWAAVETPFFFSFHAKWHRWWYCGNCALERTVRRGDIMKPPAMIINYCAAAAPCYSCALTLPAF